MTSVTATSLRVLGRLRLSRATHESTSIDRQREIVQQWADANGHTVVGWAVDSDVSGSVDPFDTPELGPWLNRRSSEFDVVAAWKLDRLGRNAIQLNKLFGWCQDNEKTLVCVADNIDLSHWAGRMLANVIAGLAEGELEQIRERQRSSKRKLRELGRWSGGKPPYGYRSERRDDEAGWRLVVDEPAAEVVERIVDDFLNGLGLSTIARALTAEGYRTPGAYYRTLKAGEPDVKGPPEECRWTSTPIRNMLRSKALRGVSHHQGETVRDDDGQPVQVAEPLVSIDEWELLQAELDRIQASRSNNRLSEVYPLTGIANCYRCDSVLHHNRSSVTSGRRTYDYRHYKCSNKACKASMIPADDLEELAEEGFLREVGDIEVRQRFWVLGDSRDEDLREAVAALDELSKTAGRAKSKTGKERLQRQLDALDERILELESAPGREARWEYRPTGKTYADVWTASDAVARRDLLLKSGIRIKAAVSGRTKSSGGSWEFEIEVPDEIYDSLGIGGGEQRIEADKARAKEERQRWGVPESAP